MPLFIVKNEGFTGPTDAVAVSGSSELSVRKIRSAKVRYEIGCPDTGNFSISELASCYRGILEKAASLKCADIAIPMFGENSATLSKEEVLNAAVTEIAAFLKGADMLVYLKVRNPADLTLPETIEKELSHSIREQQKTAEENNHSGALFLPRLGIWGGGVCAAIGSPLLNSLLARKMNNGSKTFQERLLELIREKNMDEVTVYKNANIDRKLFSRIRCNKNYTPSKSTALALAIALQLNLEETKDLLLRAGMALSPSITFDIIVSCCIENQFYDISKINVVLFRETEQYLGERPARKSGNKKEKSEKIEK